MTRGSTVVPAWARRDDLVACVGGPMGGQWFYRRDWDTRVNAAAYMQQRTGARAGVLGYRLTSEIVTHPHHAGCVGHAAVFDGPSGVTRAY